MIVLLSGSIEAKSLPITSPVLKLTREDLAAFDPLTRLAAKMMIKDGTAILVDQEGGGSVDC